MNRARAAMAGIASACSTAALRPSEGCPLAASLASTKKAWSMPVSGAFPFSAETRKHSTSLFSRNSGVQLSAFDPTSGCRRGGMIPICYQYQNFAKAKINGFEFESVYDAAWGFAGLSASVIDGHTVSYKGVRADLTTVPSAQVAAQLGFRFFEDRLTIGGEVQYNGAPVARAALEKGVPTRIDFFGVRLALQMLAEGLRADLIIGNNVLSQVPGRRSGG